MATASSAQREPSMEEILASIRRIIEDSDPGKKLPEATSELRQDREPAPVEKAEAEVETFRAELRAVPDVGRPFTLADVQARMAAELPLPEMSNAIASDAASAEACQPEALTQTSESPVTEQHAMGGEDAKVSATSVPEGSDTIVADWRRDIVNAGQPRTVLSTVESRHEEAAAPQSEIELSEDELTEGSSAEDAKSAFKSDISTIDNELAGRPAIVSEHTGRQVAAAFGELSEAFAARSKKSFDEMAEEMLRPMLQDWLDNNLPTLVERLVREEIERVARGA